MATKQKKPMAKTIIKAAVIIGVLIIPLMYSYFYLSAFWDPYSRLQDVICGGWSTWHKALKSTVKTAM